MQSPSLEGLAMSEDLSIRNHFKRLFDFRGRENRASFWPYAAVAFIIIVVAGMVIFVPMMVPSPFISKPLL